jgi:hypothetical protein
MDSSGVVRVPIPPDIDPVIAVVKGSRDGAPTVLTSGGLVSGSKSLICLGLFICTVGFALFSASKSPEEHIATLERLAARAESAQRLSPETRKAVTDLLAQSHYDCDRLKCGPRLQERSLRARAKLTNAIAGVPIPATATADIRD